MKHQRINTQHAATENPNEREAIRELQAGLAQEGMTAVMFFCSPLYDLAKLGSELRAAFDVPLIGCTSSGQIGPGGFQKGGITAVSLAASDLAVRSYLMRGVAQRAEAESLRVAELITADNAKAPANHKSFNLVLVDGLSLAEERVVAALYQSLDHAPIVGGSAGDDLVFSRTYIYVDGEFISDAALCVTFSTSIPFTTFKFQHFLPTETQLLITEADPATRTVREIDGEPAAVVYARLLGMPLEDLNEAIFAANPFVLNFDGEVYVRSPQKQNPDLSLTFYCAIEEGMVLTIGRKTDPLATIEDAFANMRQCIDTPSLVIGFDCIQRRIEFEASGLAERVGGSYASQKVFGFSTYGEQFNGIHMNQTFTGIAIGN